MKRPTILLVDNGSSKAASVRSLRRLASALSAAAGFPVHPISLQHADKIPPQDLDDSAADTFAPFLRRRLALGERRFLILPLFFGPSRALSSFIPQQVSELEATFGPIDLRLAPELCPMPAGEPRLAAILCQQATAAAGGAPPRRVILVDHGSPEPQVTAVRRYLADRMQEMLGPEVDLQQAVMERRKGAAYDFNGELLEQVLRRAAEADEQSTVTLSLLFLSPGRHAGQGGDIDQICRSVHQRHPQLQIRSSGLVGAHPDLTGILLDRLRSGLGDTEILP
jgi:sirohydrochlorin ferrochelatase